MFCDAAFKIFCDAGIVALIPFTTENIYEVHDCKIAGLEKLVQKFIHSWAVRTSPKATQDTASLLKYKLCYFAVQCVHCVVRGNPRTKQWTRGESNSYLLHAMEM